MSAPIAAVKPVTTGNGMNLMAPPSFASPSAIRMTPGHERGGQQAVHAVLLHDAVDDHDERAGGPADLHPRAAERRDQEAGDDRGVEAAVRRDAAGDGERDRQGQRDDADDHPGDRVGGELLAGVGLEGGDQLGDEHLAPRCRPERSRNQIGAWD